MDKYNNQLEMENENIAFDAYSLSYRGYVPNDKHWIGEGNMISDSLSLFEFVEAKVRHWYSFTS